MRVHMYGFRGKCIVSGELVYGDLITDIEGVAIATDVRITDDVGAFLKRSKQVESNTVGQYTGLKDKNGRKIYEGDIATGKVFNDVWTGEVKYLAPYYAVLGTRSHVILEDLEELRIIGNIYENNDLLEGKE